MGAEPEFAHEQLNRSEQKTWRRGVQDTKSNAGENSQAEVCERLAIGGVGKFSFPHGLREPRAQVFGKRSAPLEEEVLQTGLVRRDDKAVEHEQAAAVSRPMPP